MGYFGQRPNPYSGATRVVGRKFEPTTRYLWGTCELCGSVVVLTNTITSGGEEGCQGLQLQNMVDHDVSEGEGK